MKKFFSIFALLSVLSYAGLGDFLKSTGKSLTETCNKCDAKYKELIDDDKACVYGVRNDAIFHKCSDFVKNCKCWIKEGSYEQDSFQRDFIFKRFESSLMQYSEEKEAERKAAQEDSIRKAYLLEQAKQDSIRKEQARQDSIIKAQRMQEWKEQQMASLREDILKKTEEIKQLLKANKLQECAEECNLHTGTSFEAELSKDSLFKDLCKKQLTAKVKKLPKNKITSPALAYIYYDCEADDKCPKIIGFVFQNDGKMMLIEDLVWKGTIMVQHIGHIGECQLRPNRQIPFAGYGKYLGDKTYTTVTGARQSVPNYQLLWCGN